MRADLLVQVPSVVAECPLWDAARSGLWWVDVRQPSVSFWSDATGRVQTWPVQEPVGCIALTDKNRVLLGLGGHLAEFDPFSGRVQPIVCIEPEVPAMRLNDGRVDPTGRLWIGSMSDLGDTPAGSLWTWEPGQAPVAAIREIFIPNALAFSSDGSRGTFADTHTGDVISFATADPFKSRVLLKSGAAAGRPDGAAMDQDGCVWNARFAGSCVVRITPEGKVDRTINLPASNVTACAFGGSDLKTLYVTTASKGLSAQERVRQPLAGSIFAIHLDQQGVADGRISDAALCRSDRRTSHAHLTT